MGDKEILTQLYKILDKCSNDVWIYNRISEMSRRSYLQNFFKKLSYQKKIFCRRIRYEIKEIESEIPFNQATPGLSGPNDTPRTFRGFPSLKADAKQSLLYCLTKEREYLNIYKSLLSNIHSGNLREMLINQKHAVQLIINEIKGLEAKYYSEKNEGEVNYS